MAQAGQEHPESDPLRVVIAAGGTAGHVVPAVAVADELRAEGAKVSFLGTRDRAEAKIVPEAGYEIDFLDLKGLDRRNPLKAADALAKAAAALPHATKVLKDRSASVVLGGGGYVAGPAGLAALGLGIPLVLTEADSHLGLTNRALAHRADAVCLSFPIAGRDHPPFIVTGRPLPTEFASVDREAARSRFGLAPDDVCVLIVGGSLGARSLNLAAIAALAPLEVKVIHISGERDYDEVSGQLETRGNPSNYTLLRYEPGLGEVLAACDLVVGRSGGSVFEFCAAGRPALLIPYPHATADHQTRNAQWMITGGAARLLPDSELDAGTLRREVEDLLADRERLAAMAAASAALARPQAAREVSNAVIAAARGERIAVEAQGSPPPPPTPTIASAGAASEDLAHRNFHFIGIGGAGMSGLAAIAALRGARVGGSDRSESSYLARLRGFGIDPRIGHDASHVPAEAEVVVSTAIGDDNPELAVARERGQKILHRGELLAELSRGSRLIAVAGTHGKTTTTALCVHLLRKMGADPGYLIGGELPGAGPSGSPANAGWGAGEWMVTEADESDASFLELDPEVAVVTNIELDHHARWASLDDLHKAFAGFVSEARSLAEGPGVDLSASGRTLRFEISEPGGRPPPGDPAEVQATDLSPTGSGTSFKVAGLPGLPDGLELETSSPGRHNVLNALAALSAVGLSGLLDDADPHRVADALSSFPGVARRFESKGRTSTGALVFDDYAHHPTEVAAALNAAREFGSGKVVAVFQPHLYSRTKALSREFGQALAAADEVGVLEVYPAREEPVGDLEGVTGRWVAEAAADAASGKPVWWLRTRDDALAALSGRLREGDLLLTLGAGDINLLADDLVSEARR